MEEKIVPLTESDIIYIRKRQRSFIIESLKRYLALGLMFLFFFLITTFNKSFKGEDFSTFYWIFAGVGLVFTIINIYLYRKFYSNALFKNKKIISGTIMEKGYSHAIDGTFEYQIDHEEKVLQYKFTHKLGAAKSRNWVRLGFGKKNFDGYVPLGEFLYFVLDGTQIAVDVSHFANFDMGENIQIEKLAETDEMMRIFSLDIPEKCIELNTHKFFITAKGIKAMG